MSTTAQLKAIGDALKALNVTSVVVLGNENRTPMPTGDFVVMTPIMQERIATNITEYPDVPGTLTHEALREDYMPAFVAVQLDCYGANSAAMINQIALYARSDLFFGYGFTPVFATEPRQLPFFNSELQQQQRWTIDLTVQMNDVLSRAQQSALTITTPTPTGIPA